MQGQNEEKSEGGVTNIQEEEITYVRKRKVENVEAEVIDRSEFEKHIESKSVAIRHRKLPTRLQPPRKLQKKEGGEKDQEEGKDQKEEEGNNVEDDDENNDSEDDGEDDNKGDVKMKEKDEKEEMEDDSEEEKKINKKNQTQKKKRKIEKEEDGEDVQVVEANEQDKLVKRQPYQRVPPTQFMKDVLINLSEKQKQAIRNIGFGGFLELDLPIHINSMLTENLVTNFDTERCCLMLPKRKQEIFLEAIDVHLAYGLPLGGKRIKQPNDESNLKWSKFLKAWRSKFGLKKGSPTNKRLIDRIQELKKEKTVSDEFLWNFVVCVVNCCIRSTNNTQLYIKFLYSCMDVKKIAELDWCTFVIEHLKDSVNVWKKGNSYFTGPLPFLMVFYFDRLQRGGLEKPRKCPLISVWTKERIQVRYKFEKDHGFGYGKILERMESIVEENKKQSRQEDKEKRKEESSMAPKGKKKQPKQKEKEKRMEKSSMAHKEKETKNKGKEGRIEQPSIGSSSTTSRNDMMGFLSKFGDLAKTLASNVKEMYGMLEQAKDLFVEEETTGKMQHLIDNIWCKYTTKTFVNQEEKKSPSILRQDQHVFNEPAFIEELDMVMDKAWKKFEEKRSPKTPTVDLRSKEEEKDKNKEERNEENKDKNLLIPSPVVENQEDSEAELTYKEVTANVLNCAFLNPDHPPRLDEEEKQEEEKEEKKEEEKEEKKEEEKEKQEKKKEEEKEEKQEEKKEEKEKKKEEEKEEKQEEKKEEKGKKKEEEKKENQDEKKEEKGKKKEEEKEENQEEKKENEGSKNEEKNKEEKNENKKGKQGEEKGEEKTRKIRGKDKLPMYLRSPFMVEHEKLFKNVDNRKVAENAFAQGDNKELLYADNMGTTITRDEIHSLIEDNHMLNNVVDAYVCLLNFENKRRGVDKKSRFFFTTECYLIRCTKKYFKSNERQEARMKALFDRMQQEMTTAEVTSFKSIQLLNAFGDFVHSIDSNIKNDFVSSFKTRNLSMSWKSNKNKHDCGVFLLKHMETYEGEFVKQWNSGLELDNFDQMKKLRVEYCGKIITAEVNEERNRVIRRSKKWSKENKMDI